MAIFAFVLQTEIKLNKLVLLFSIAGASLTSCVELNSKIDENYVLKTDGEVSNVDTLSTLLADASLDSTITSGHLKMSDVMKGGSSVDFNHNILNTDSEVITIPDAKLVLLKAEVAKIFDPKNHPCSLPEKISKKLNRAKDEGKPWAPSFVVTHISRMPDTVLYVPKQSISVLLHNIVIKKATGQQFNWVLTTSASFKSFDVESYTHPGRDAFFYSLDCSGYLNAAIEGSGAVPGADIKTAAKSALETQNSMFIGGGIVVSPISAAYYGNLVEMDKSMRVRILESVLAIDNIDNNDVVSFPLSYEAVWASKTGSSSFNGKAELNSGVRGGIGVAQISASSNGGGQLSRKSSFSNFDTYISRVRPQTHPTVITVSKIRERVNAIKTGSGTIEGV